MSFLVMPSMVPNLMGFFGGFEQFVDILNEHFFCKKEFLMKTKNFVISISIIGSFSQSMTLGSDIEKSIVIESKRP